MHSNVLYSMLNNVLQNYLYDVECLKLNKVLLLEFMLEKEIKLATFTLVYIIINHDYIVFSVYV